MGVKKSTVWTNAKSAVRRYTPASSAVSKPIRTFGSVCFGSLASTESKILGLNLAAQPAAFTIAVSRVRSPIEFHYMLTEKARSVNSLVQYSSFVILNQL